MPRTFPLCACTLALASALIAADPPKKVEAPTRTTISLTVSAMAEPRPALRYTLLPELKDMNPGNPVQGYLKCFMEQSHFFFDRPAYQDREKWSKMPLNDLPLDKLRDYGGVALRRADEAARLDTPDWQVLLELKKEGIDLLLPEVQQMRALTFALKVRFRAEVAEKRFDAAIRTAQTMLALSRHLGEHPTLIADLVGIAVAFVAVGPLEEMLQQPGCPNLYWALTDLPRPFIDLRKGMQGERAILAKDLAMFGRDTPLDEARTRAALKRLDYLAEAMLFKPMPKPSVTLARRAEDVAFVAAARKRVIAAGLTEEKVKALPAIQIVLIDAKNEFENARANAMKWVNVPWPKAEAGLSAALKGAIPFHPFASNTLLTRTRLDQRIALLRHVEAIRLYAATHGGKVPAALADIDVPLPDDPFTGKPFRYSGVEGKTAIIRGTAPRGMEKTAAFNVEYHVTIR